LKKFLIATYRIGSAFQLCNREETGPFMREVQEMMIDGNGAPAMLKAYDVAIIGGGCSGVLLCIHLLRRTQRRLSIALIDRSPRPGRGVAYSTDCAVHLLNVPVGGMSAFPDDMRHFGEWLSRSEYHDAGVGSFVPRRLYGEYLESVLGQCSENNSHCRLSHLSGEASSVVRNSTAFDIGLSRGIKVRAKQVVLAMGNARPADPLWECDLPAHLYASYAWDERALSNIPAKGEVLILGSGLTAVDQVLALRAASFDGRITIVSRRGKLPATHRASTVWTTRLSGPLPATVSSTTRWVRNEIERAAALDVDWRSVIDSVRPWTQLIWKGWPLEERRRFLRHARPFWEVARHRLPPCTSEIIREMEASGALRILAGRVVDAFPKDSRVQVALQWRGNGEPERLSVDRIINCTGPGTSHRVQEPLIEKLWERGLVLLDELGLGICTDDDGRVISDSGDPIDGLYALGPMRKATLWESTAVPEIRQQAAALAARLASHSSALSYVYR
jgi:uncharacterized NAD(P)/FAD-binding protein YdhS